MTTTTASPSLARFSSAHSKVFFPYFNSSGTATNTLSSTGVGLTSSPATEMMSPALLTDVLKLYCDDKDVSHRRYATAAALSILPDSSSSSRRCCWRLPERFGVQDNGVSLSLS
ncbi:hypothetical protein BS78_04G223100 [Paspalum vaginatum]|nr:hypothetical protein BS78_04G223100 [Paspalum vaginatum]